MDKKRARKKRATRTRAKIRELRVPRLTIHRTSCHIYAQIIDYSGKVLVAASTVQKELQQQIAGHKGGIEAAKVVGKGIAERAKQANIVKVAFDRSGFKYHGRIKALADAAREAGLEF